MKKKIFGKGGEKIEAVPTKNVLIHRLHGNMEPAAKGGVKNIASHMIVPMPDLSWMEEKDQK